MTNKHDCQRALDDLRRYKSWQTAGRYIALLLDAEEAGIVSYGDMLEGMAALKRTMWELTT